LFLSLFDLDESLKVFLNISINAYLYNPRRKSHQTDPNIIIFYIKDMHSQVTKKH
jgi:hypothetical protein